MAGLDDATDKVNLLYGLSVQNERVDVRLTHASRHFVQQRCQHYPGVDPVEERRIVVSFVQHVGAERCQTQWRVRDVRPKLTTVSRVARMCMKCAHDRPIFPRMRGGVCTDE